ncbi:hypothetical protein V5O48_019031, partial [Marasmius crinis-equi]
SMSAHPSITPRSVPSLAHPSMTSKCRAVASEAIQDGVPQPYALVDAVVVEGFTDVKVQGDQELGLPLRLMWLLSMMRR